MAKNKKSSKYPQSEAQMGYSKPIGSNNLQNKYHCMVTGEKRMQPCGGCTNPKGCLTKSMQYKES